MTPVTGNDGLIASGTIAPEIALPLFNVPGARAPITRAGELTLAAFFKESCPTCRFTFPFLERLHRMVAPHGGRVVGVSQNDASDTSTFRDELDLTMPILIDAPDLALSRWFDLVAVPTLYLFDDGGAIRRGVMGFDKRVLEEMAAALAGGIGAEKPSLWNRGEEIPESRPG